MNKAGKILLIISFIIVALAIFSAVVTMLYLESTDQKEETYSSSYNYDITIETDGQLDNVTLYLPVPVHENESAVGQDMVTKDFYRNAPDWNFSLVDTEYGIMLKITNSRLAPIYHSAPVAISENEEEEEDTGTMESVVSESNEYSDETPIRVPIQFSVTTFVNESINTKYPVGNDSVLLPKFNLSSSEPEYDIPSPDYINPEYFEYESRVFAQYNTSNQTDVYIRVEATGTNEWWVGGWRFNTFQDTVSVQMTGSQGAWIAAEGNMITGDGIYDD